VVRNCNFCGRPYEAKHVTTSKFCGVNCRNRNARGAPPPPTPPVVSLSQADDGDTTTNDLNKATKAELEAAGKLDTSLGQQAMSLAVRMGGFDTGGGLAALSRELRAVMAEATHGAKASVDVVDELRARRNAKRSC